MTSSEAALLNALAEVAHFLPAQAPIHAFVHHNTLHAFEDLDFHEAVEAAAELFSAEPYPTESAFRAQMQKGQLNEEDIEFELSKHHDIALSQSMIGGLRFIDFCRFRLRHLFEVPETPVVQWLLAEDELCRAAHELVSEERLKALESFARDNLPAGKPEKVALSLFLRALWDRLSGVSEISGKALPVRGERRREQILRAYGEDIDDRVLPMMMRLAGAYLDQGLSYWPMPQRENGFFASFTRLYIETSPADIWLQGLPEIFRQAPERRPEQWCVWSLEQMRIPEEEWETYIRNLLLKLPGWAGMFHQFEVRPEKAPTRALPATLVDFAAVFLVLECQAVTSVLRRRGGEASMSELESLARKMSRTSRLNAPSLAYEAFVLAQACNVSLAAVLQLPSAWLEWVRMMPELRRRRLLLAASESRHLMHLSGALTQHVDWLRDREAPELKYQAVFCIDDREESLRRHWEEVEPGVQTFGFPGFFGVAMQHVIEGQPRSRDLCPVNMKATHRVCETGEGASRASRANYHVHVGSKTLLRGFLVSVLGFLSAIPLVLGVLFPRWFHLKRKPPIQGSTKLSFRREDENEPTQEAVPLGYTTLEMTELVKEMLLQIGLTHGFAPLVFVIGHGSSSTNNPHRAAYGCGATAGGCGGPNARVIAGMANSIAVREQLRLQGIDIPAQTSFVGGMHDTCTDDVILYDLEELEPSVRALVQQAEGELRVASERNAVERCRLFDQVPLGISPQAAKKVVEARSVDLSEPRPEYNHAKNSCCIVAQRKWTRGLFLDQRAFLTSYDPAGDPEGEVLKRVLLGSAPVGMGINLEYFFSAMDQRVYGAGSKLPHNVSGLIGVMDGHSSDLRTGLYRQMIELHEPLRLVAIVEASCEVLTKIIQEEPRLGHLVKGGWLYLVAFDAEKNRLFFWGKKGFRLIPPSTQEAPSFDESSLAFAGQRGVLPFANIAASMRSRLNAPSEVS